MKERNSKITKSNSLEKYFKKFTCSICGKEYLEYGNNAQPVNNGICCNNCNEAIVMHTREFEKVKYTKFNLVKLLGSKKAYEEWKKEFVYEIVETIMFGELYHRHHIRRKDEKPKYDKKERIILSSEW